MKGLVLCGGKGVRLRPLTFSRAKQLIEIANRPILAYVLDDIRSAGIEEVVLVISPQTGDQIKEVVGDGEAFGLKATYVVQPEPLGIAHTLLVAQDALGDEPFLLYLGDNLVSEGAKVLVDDFRTHQPNASILLSEVDDPSMFGVAELKDGKIADLVEKPAEPKSNLALVGIYLFDDTIFKAVSSIQPSKRGELEITDAIQWLIDNGYSVHYQELSGWWLDTGKKDDMLAANEVVLSALAASQQGTVDDASFLDGLVVVEEGASVVRCKIIGPTIIGERSTVVDSTVGPFVSIGSDCRVSSANLNHSILLKGSRIEGVGPVTGSILGRDSVVSRGSAQDEVFVLMIGDESHVVVP